MQMKDHLKRRQLMAQSLMLGVGPSPLPRRSPQERLNLARGALRRSAARARGHLPASAPGTAAGQTCMFDARRCAA